MPSDLNVAKLARLTLVQIHTNLDLLRSLGVIRSQRFASDYAEWLVCQLLQGELAANKVQKGWDFRADGKRISVKSHAKSSDNKTRWTSTGELSNCDELVIVVMTNDFLVRELYRVPSDIAAARCGNRQRLQWDKLVDFSVFPPIHNIPDQFRELFVQD